jgi:hypothetical protein
MMNPAVIYNVPFLPQPLVFVRSLAAKSAQPSSNQISNQSYILILPSFQLTDPHYATAFFGGGLFFLHTDGTAYFVPQQLSESEYGKKYFKYAAQS